LPRVVTLPGFRVSNQVPDGREFSVTLPVANAQVGWVIPPLAGAEGVTGWAFITAFVDAADVQPTEFVTVKV
jgi:hypothetical protein